MTAIETDWERASQRSARVVLQWVRSASVFFFFTGGGENEMGGSKRREREKKV